MNIDILKKNVPTILTITGCIGVVLTSVMGIRTGLKIADELDEEKPDILKIAKDCIPLAISGVVTIGCVASADIFNRQQKNELLMLCSLAGSSYSNYRKEVIRRYGAEVDEEISDTVAGNSVCCYMAPDIPDKKVHWILDMCDERIPIYEFDAYERDVIHAEYHLNRNYILQMMQTVGNFLEFLEVISVKNENDISRDFGWCIDDSEIYFIDFEHEKIDDDNFRIHPVFAPWYKPGELDMFGEEF